MNGRNLISSIKACSCSTLSAGIVDWTVEDVLGMDRKTRATWIEKLEHVARLYLPRKGGGRELIGIEECVKKESKSLHGYLTNSTYGVDAANGFVGEGAC